MAFSTERMNAGAQRAFGLPATYTRATGGDPVALTVVPGDGNRLLDVQPQTVVRWARIADLPAGYSRGDTLAENATAYTVVEIRFDGTGGVFLILDKA